MGSNTSKLPDKDQEDGSISNATDKFNIEDHLPNYQVKRLFKIGVFLKEFKDRYETLHMRTKLCLLCFAIFPEDAEVKRRLLRYWWIGERLIRTETDNEVNEIIEELEGKGFIIPVPKRSRLKPISYKVHPIIRYFLIKFAMDANFFNFNLEGNPTNNISLNKKSCLIQSESSTWLISKQGQQDPLPEDLHELETLFNVSKQFADIPKEQLYKMKNIRVLYLGICGSTDERQLEVENYKFLKGLKKMKKLRFFSLYGVSGISMLPSSLGNLTKLRILDLRACHNLEEIPNQIGSLKMLNFLDLSQCYLLDNIPQQVSHLSELKVFKGFILGHGSCSLESLTKLKKLEKLSINMNINDRKLSIDKMGADISKFPELKILKISWAARRSTKEQKEKDGDKSQPKGDIGKQDAENRESCLVDKLKLEKLDLKCYPTREPPRWLVPENLTRLKRLYIRGGRFINLGERSDKLMQWKVQTLRLRHLYRLKMNWKELQRRFPKMIYLEKVNCPQITFCPCHANGIWSK